MPNQLSQDVLSHLLSYLDFNQHAPILALTSKPFYAALKKTAEGNCKNPFFQTLQQAMVDTKKPSPNPMVLWMCFCKKNFEKMSEILNAQHFLLWVVSYETHSSKTIQRLKNTPRSHFFSKEQAMANTANASSVKHWLPHQFKGVSAKELTQLKEYSEQGAVKPPLPDDPDSQSTIVRP
jgi:hypothetical protein